MRWAYEMGRARDGGLVFLRGSRWHPPNMAAAHGLFLCLPERRLQILGGDSVFARRPPKDLEKAAQLYKDKKWTELRAFLVDYIAQAERATSVPADDLTQISGIGPTFARRLQAAGITTFAKMAALSPDYLREVSQAATWQADPEEWIAQANALA